jgi:glutathione S-transferase
MSRIESPASPLVARLQGLHLFHFDGAPCAQRVRFALAEKGLVRGPERRFDADDAASLVAAPGTWTSREVSLIRKDHLTEAYAAIQPNMVVPALVHDGVLWTESMDIVAYLDEAFPDSEPLLPRADPERAGALELVELGKSLHRSLRFVSFRWGLGRLAKLSAEQEAELERLERDGSPERLLEFYSRYDRDEIPESVYLEHLRALELAFLQLDTDLAGDGRAFLCGSSLSVADILWSVKLVRLVECGYPFARHFPALAAWLDRIRARPAFESGVMGHHRAMHRAFRAKAAVERLVGSGLATASARPSERARPQPPA